MFDRFTKGEIMTLTKADLIQQVYKRVVTFKPSGILRDKINA